MANKNITTVNFNQLQLLLKYAVALNDANTGDNAGRFIDGEQYFVSTADNKLTIYDGAGNIKYEGSPASKIQRFI